jgi:ParB family transcriptional regulator, chromosome partitioning protein
MTNDNQGNQRNNPPRKLGRGLNALLAVPVEINLSPTAGGARPAVQGTPPDERTASERTPTAGSPRPESGAEQREGRAAAPLTTRPSADEADSTRTHTVTAAGTSGLDVPRGTVGVGAFSEGSPLGFATPMHGGSSVEVPRGTQPPNARGSEVASLAVDQLRPNPRQPRQDFDDAALASLAESIRTAGLMQPIIARPLADGSFEIVAGERRWRAARRLGLATIPAIVRQVDDQTAAEWALIENIQREDLNPMDRALALRKLAEEFQLTHQQLGERVGLDRASVSNLLRLADLDPFTADAVRRGKLTQGHAKALLAVSRVDHRQTLAAAAISGDWSVRELERRVQHTNRQIDPSQRVSPVASAVKGSAHLEDLERRLSEYLGSRVTIQLGRKKGSGRIAIDFFTLDQFDGVVAKMGFVDRV